MTRIILVSMAVFAMVFGSSMAATYTVGGPSGSWDEATDLETWVKPLVFVTGDKLVFQYAKTHDVVEVPKADYDACQTTNAIVTDNSGKSVVPLNKPGKRYFICGIPGHCAAGMKLAVNVLASTRLAASSPLASTALPPTTMPGAPIAGLSQSPVSMPPAEHSSATRGRAFMPFFAVFIAAFAVLAF